MKKLVLFIIIIIVCIGCSSPLKKTILEPLSLKELNSLIKNDILFENLYRQIENYRNNVLKTDSERVKWVDLTYERISKLSTYAITLFNDSLTTNKLEDQWTIKYGIYYAQLDSILNEWKHAKSLWSKFKNENDRIDQESDDIDRIFLSDRDKLNRINKLILEMENNEKLLYEFKLLYNSFPQSVKDFMEKKEKGENAKEDQMIKDLMNVDYINKDDYIKQEQYKILKSIDALAFDFLIMSNLF